MFFDIVNKFIEKYKHDSKKKFNKKESLDTNSKLINSLDEKSTYDADENNSEITLIALL